MKKLITLSLLFMSPAAAFGADLLGKPPSVIRQPALTAAPLDSSGFYLGVNFGAGFGDLSTSGAALLANPNASVDVSKVNRSGALGGVQAGYAVQSDSLVYGVEADMDFGALRGTLNMNGQVSTPAVFPTTLASQTGYNARLESRINALGTLRGRIGYAFDNVLIYGTGGYATAHHNGKVSLAATGVPLSGTPFTPSADTSLGTARVHEWLHGWTLGVGAEYAFTRNVGLKVEYLYAQFNNKVAGQSVAHSVNLVRSGVNYRF